MKLFSIACLLVASSYAINLQAADGVNVVSLDALVKKSIEREESAAPETTEDDAPADTEAESQEETTAKKVESVVDAYDSAKGAIANAEKQLIEEEQDKAADKIG